MTWNYRVMRYDPVLPGEAVEYGIAEVYYDNQGKPNAYSGPACIGWDEGEDGAKILALMAKAFTLPVLTPKDFGG